MLVKLVPDEKQKEWEECQMNALKGPRWPGLLRGCLEGLRALKKENYRVTYGFTELRGKPAGRGRDGRASGNQVTAGAQECGSWIPDLHGSAGEGET